MLTRLFYVANVRASIHHVYYRYSSPKVAAALWQVGTPPVQVAVATLALHAGIKLTPEMVDYGFR